MRFYDIQKGQILLTGMTFDVGSATAKEFFWIRVARCLSLSGTIASNIRLGTPGITEEVIYRAARDVNLRSLLMNCLMHVEEVKERGSTFPQDRSN
jgi:ABC-type multidrug transport system fused ATPase/permease subunit